LANAFENYGHKNKPPAFAEFFKSTDPDRQKKDGDVYCLPLHKLVPFSQHPFKLYTGEKLAEMAESIKERGVVCPIIVRQQDDEHYEIIAGHNRAEAAKIAELEDIPAIIREVDDDTATLMMIESNLNQRENILPSERGQAYKLQKDTLNHRGKRGTSYQNDTRLETLDVMAENEGISRAHIARYIRLTSLIPDLSDMVDESKLNFTFGVDLSYLTPEHQQTVYELIQEKGYRLTAANVNKLKELEKSDGLNEEQIVEIIAVTKPAPKAPSVKRTVTRIMKQYSVPSNRVNDFLQMAVETFIQTEQYRKEFDASG
jgi:ParB family chromosome partitioning protein